MALLPSILILFDTTALLAGKTREWQEFSRLGECYVSEGVVEQMQFMHDRASEPDVETTAREFNRFYPTSGWKQTSAIAEHPSLKPAAGHTLSKRARLSLEVLGCAYGLALRYPESLVVLVANDQPMLKQVLGLQTKNLCGLPLAAFIQWHRSQRRPPVVSQHLQQLRSQPAPIGDLIARKSVASKSGKSPSPRSAVVSPPSVSYGVKRQQQAARSLRISSLLSSLVSVVILLVAVAAVWRVISPASFNQLWQQSPIGGAKK